MSVARFIADQRTKYRVPVAVCCAILGLSAGWFYKWIKAPVTSQTRRRRDLDAAVRELFCSTRRGSPTARRACTATCSRPAGGSVRTRSRIRCDAKGCSAANPSAARD